MRTIYEEKEKKNNTNGIQSAVDVVSRAMNQLKILEFQIKVNSPNGVEYIEVKRLMEVLSVDSFVLVTKLIACLCERDMLSIAKMSVESVRECLEIACKTASRSVSYLGCKGMIGK